MGFLISLSPLSCDLMGWRGAGGSGAAGMYVFIHFDFVQLRPTYAILVVPITFSVVSLWLLVAF